LQDGLEAVRRLRKEEAENNEEVRYKVIGLSANSDEQSMEEAYAVGMDAFISKPLSLAFVKEYFVRMGVGSQSEGKNEGGCTMKKSDNSKHTVCVSGDVESVVNSDVLLSPPIPEENASVTTDAVITEM
jgi:DNA-binding response OmpR family regulator